MILRNIMKHYLIPDVVVATWPQLISGHIWEYLYLSAKWDHCDWHHWCWTERAWLCYQTERVGLCYQTGEAWHWSDQRAEHCTGVGGTLDHCCWNCCSVSLSWQNIHVRHKTMVLRFATQQRKYCVLTVPWVLGDRVMVMWQSVVHHDCCYTIANFIIFWNYLLMLICGHRACCIGYNMMINSH